MRNQSLKKSMAALIIILVICFLSGCGNGSGQAGESGDSGGKLSSLDDLKDKKIGVLLGGIHDQYANERFPEATVMQYKSPSDLLLAVKTEKVDAAFFSYESLLVIMREDDDLGFVAENLFSVPMGMGFNKNNDQLREEFNQFLKQCKADGVYEDMVKRWVIEGSTDMPEITNPQNNGRLTVGYVSDKGLPFAIVKNNRIVGFDIEMAQRFAAYLGKKLVLEDMEFSSLIAACASGKIDMIDSTLIITEERKKQIDFSDPYYEMGNSIFALKKNIADDDARQKTSLDDLDDKRIGVITGTAGEEASEERFPDAHIHDMENLVSATAALKSNKIDALVYERATLTAIANQDPQLEVIEEPVKVVDVAVAVKKGNSALLDSVNRAITELENAGILDDMRKRWFADEGYLPDMPRLDPPDTQEILRVGTEALMPPFEFIDSNNQCVGFDIELAQRIGQILNKRIIVNDMNFIAIIPALEAEKIDLAISCFNITEERLRKVDFSIPYHTSENVALVRKTAGGPVSPGGGFFSNLKNSFYSNIIQEQRYLLIFDGLRVTVIISLFSFISGTVLGFLICLMTMVKNRFIKTVAHVYISILQGVPDLVLLMIIFYVVFAAVEINPVIVAVITFGMHFAAYVAEMLHAAIKTVDKGQREAGIAIGFTSWQAFIYIILPQALRRVLPVYKGEFITMVKMTSVVGYIAVADLTKASDIIRSRTFDAFFPLVMVAALYFAISWLLILTMDYIDRKTDPKRKSKQAA